MPLLLGGDNRGANPGIIAHRPCQKISSPRREFITVYCKIESRREPHFPALGAEGAQICRFENEKGLRAIVEKINNCSVHRHIRAVSGLFMQDRTRQQHAQG